MLLNKNTYFALYRENYCFYMQTSTKVSTSEVRLFAALAYLSAFLIVAITFQAVFEQNPFTKSHSV